MGRSPASGSADPLEGAGARRVRNVRALGGVPFEESDDGVQQVRLELLESTAAGREVQNPPARSTIVASRVAVDWHRSQGRADGLRGKLAAQGADGVAPERSEDDRVLEMAVAAGLERLSLRQRQVIVLRFYADLPVRDIAVVLDIPEGTVKSRLHGAILAMRDRLREDEVI